MMFKFAELRDGKIKLVVFTGSPSNDSFYLPLRDTLTAKVIGIKNGKPVDGAVFFSPVRVYGESIVAGACNLGNSLDVFTAQYQGDLHRLELGFSTRTTYQVPGCPGYSKKFDFGVSREDCQPCSDRLLEDILQHFPDEQYMPLEKCPEE